jgi:osomolarity two-component system sensor histidine kinase SLN1
MRIPIRIQLGSLLLLSSLAGLAVISVATWITTQRFVLEIRASRLALTASLKAAQLASNLDVMQTSVGFITTRVLVQRALSRYNLSGNNTETNWNSTRSDIQAAIGGGGSLGQQLLMQARIYPKNASGPSGSDSLVNSTADALAGRIPLPYFLPNGSRAYLGDTRPAFSPYAFPPDLYPNLTYFSENGVQHARYEDKVITKDSTLLLGPLAINDTFSLLSLTMPIMNNSATTDALGYLTVIMNGRLVSQVIKSSEGLGDTGHVLLIGPATKSNILPITLSFKGKSKPAVAVHYVLPLNETYEKRHPDHARRIEDVPFDAASFPLIYNALRTKGQAEQSGASLHAKNEAGKPVSVGYAMLNTNMVDWTVMLEMSRSEVWRPINILRKVILGCLFATAGLMALIAFPLAHFASQPILRLREATRRSINAQSMSGTSSLGSLAYLADGTGGEMPPQQLDVTTARKEGFSLPSVSKWRRKRGEAAQAKRFERERRAFRIPGKVRERKCWIKDELSDLTETFNEMSDELMMQYSKLEERVQQRTAELELSKKAAEAANESKTLFIAFVSPLLRCLTFIWLTLVLQEYIA